MTGENLRAKVEYVLFDLDGLMIDTEKISIIAITKLLHRFGKEMTPEMQAASMGKSARESSRYVLSLFPEIALTVDELMAEKDLIQNTLWASVPLMPGVRKLVTHLKSSNIPMAIATNARRMTLDRKTGHHQDLFSLFEGKIICGDDKEHKLQGKPAPDLFLIAAKKLLGRDVGDPNMEPTGAQFEERRKGLVFEDALPGLQAGKRAGMSVVWVPDPNLLKFSFPIDEKADMILGSLEEFRPEDWGLRPYSV